MKKGCCIEESEEDSGEVLGLLSPVEGDTRTGSERLCLLRQVVARKGLRCVSKRPLVWKLFLGVGRIDASHYASLVGRGMTRGEESIRGDARRTFPEERGGVTDEELTRVLNALRYELGEEEEKDCTGPNRCPVCAALLVVFRSEVEAFYCLNALVSNKCPAYFAKDLGGARNGAALVSAVLKCVDYGLYQAIVEPDPISFEEIYVFPLLTSFFTCLPPLAEVLKVWDALFAVGPHYVVLLVVAHTLLYRDHIITKQGGGGAAALFSIQPRNLPKLQADVLLDTARQLTVPALLYDLITQHTFRTVTIPADILQGDDDDDDRRRRRRPPDCSCSSA